MCTGPSRGEYLKILEIHNSNRIDYNVRKWETIKFFEGVYTALMTATIVAIGAAHQLNLWDSLEFRLVISFFPLIGILSAVLGGVNLRRESRLLFLEECQMFKIAKYLQLDQELPMDNLWLPGDNHLLMRKWWDFEHGTIGLPNTPNLDQWINGRMNKHIFADMFILFFSFRH